MKPVKVRFSIVSANDMSTQLYAYYALAVTGIAVAFRAWGLYSRPVWMDEAFTYLASKLPLKVIALNQIDNHPPLFYILQRFWYLVDPSVIAVRVPAAIFGSLAVVVTMFAMSDLFSRRAGIIAGAFLAISTGHIYFSQDARMYSLLSLGVAASLWGLVGLIQRPEQYIRYGFIYCIGALVGIYSQVVSLLFLAALNSTILSYLILLKSWRSVRALILMNIVVLVFSLPWLVSLPTAMRTFAGLGRHDTSTAVWFFMNMIGAPALGSVWKKAAFVVVFSGICVGYAFCWKLDRKPLFLALFSSLFIYPLLLIIINLHQSILENRVFIPCCVAACMALSAAVAGLRSNSARVVAGVLLGFPLLLSSILGHYSALKPENNKVALQEASARGYGDAPVIACGFLGASSVYLDTPERPVYFLDNGSLVKFDDRFYNAIGMSMYKLQRADAAALKPFIGEASDNARNVSQLLSTRRIILISSTCDLNDEANFIRARGFDFDQHVALPQPAPVFGSMWTKVDLFRKSEQS